MLSLFKNNRGIRSFYTDGDEESVSPIRSPRGLHGLPPNTSYTALGKGEAVVPSLQGKENRLDRHGVKDASAVAHQKKSSSFRADVEKEEGGALRMEPQRAWNGRDAALGSGSSLSATDVRFSVMDPSVVLSYALRRQDHPTPAGGSVSSAAPSLTAASMNQLRGSPLLHTNSQTVQQRCQRCWQVFPIPPFTVRCDYTCRCCGYAICCQCRCPIASEEWRTPRTAVGGARRVEKESGRGGGGTTPLQRNHTPRDSAVTGEPAGPFETPWKCSSCIRPGMTMLRYLETTKGGKEVVMRLISYCDAPTGRALKSLFRFASLYALPNDKGGRATMLSSSSTTAAAVAAAVERAARLSSSMLSSKTKGERDGGTRSPPPERAGVRGAALALSTMERRGKGDVRDGTVVHLMDEGEEEIPSAELYPRKLIERHLARMGEESPAPFPRDAKIFFPSSSPAPVVPLDFSVTSSTLSVSPDTEGRRRLSPSPSLLSTAKTNSEYKMTKERPNAEVVFPAEPTSQFCATTHMRKEHQQERCVVADGKESYETKREEKGERSAKKSETSMIHVGAVEDTSSAWNRTSLPSLSLSSSLLSEEGGVRVPDTAKEGAATFQRNASSYVGRDMYHTTTMTSTRPTSHRTAPAHHAPSSSSPRAVNGTPPSISYPLATAQPLIRTDAYTADAPGRQEVLLVEDGTASPACPYDTRSESPAPRFPSFSAYMAELDRVQHMESKEEAGLLVAGGGAVKGTSHSGKKTISAGDGGNVSGGGWGLLQVKEEDTYGRPSSFSLVVSASSSFSSLPRGSTSSSLSKQRPEMHHKGGERKSEKIVLKTKEEGVGKRETLLRREGGEERAVREEEKSRQRKDRMERPVERVENRERFLQGTHEREVEEEDMDAFSVSISSPSSSLFSDAEGEGEEFLMRDSAGRPVEEERRGAPSLQRSHRDDHGGWDGKVHTDAHEEWKETKSEKRRDEEPPPNGAAASTGARKTVATTADHEKKVVKKRKSLQCGIKAKGDVGTSDSKRKKKGTKLVKKKSMEEEEGRTKTGEREEEQDEEEEEGERENGWHAGKPSKDTQDTTHLPSHHHHHHTSMTSSTVSSSSFSHPSPSLPLSSIIANRLKEEELRKAKEKEEEIKMREHKRREEELESTTTTTCEAQGETPEPSGSHRKENEKEEIPLAPSFPVPSLLFPPTTSTGTATPSDSITKPKKRGTPGAISGVSRSTRTTHPRDMTQKHHTSTESLASSSAVYTRLYGNLSGAAVGRAILRKSKELHGKAEEKAGEQNGATGCASRLSATSLSSERKLHTSTPSTATALGRTNPSQTSPARTAMRGGTPEEGDGEREEKRVGRSPSQTTTRICKAMGTRSHGEPTSRVATSRGTSRSTPSVLTIGPSSSSHVRTAAVKQGSPPLPLPSNTPPHHTTTRSDTAPLRTRAVPAGSSKATEAIEGPPSFQRIASFVRVPSSMTTGELQEGQATVLTAPPSSVQFVRTSSSTAATLRTPALGYERVASIPNLPLERLNTACPSGFQRTPSGVVARGVGRDGAVGSERHATSGSPSSRGATAHEGVTYVRGPPPPSAGTSRQGMDSITSSGTTTRILVPSVYLDPAANYHSCVVDGRTGETTLSPSPSPVATASVESSHFRRYHSKTGASVPLHSAHFDPLEGIERSLGSPPTASRINGHCGRGGNEPHSMGAPFSRLPTALTTAGGETGNHNERTSKERDASTPFVRIASSLRRTPTPLRAFTPLQRQHTVFIPQPSLYSKPLMEKEREAKMRSGREAERKPRSARYVTLSSPPSSRGGFPLSSSHAPSPPLCTGSHASHCSPGTGEEKRQEGEAVESVTASSSGLPASFTEDSAHDNAVTTKPVVLTSTTTVIAKAVRQDKDVFGRIPTTKHFERLCSLHPPPRHAPPTTATPAKQSTKESPHRGSPSPAISTGLSSRAVMTARSRLPLSTAVDGKTSQDPKKEKGTHTTEREGRVLSTPAKGVSGATKRMRHAKPSPAAISSSYLSTSPSRPTGFSSAGVTSTTTNGEELKRTTGASHPTSTASLSLGHSSTSPTPARTTPRTGTGAPLREAAAPRTTANAMEEDGVHPPTTGCSTPSPTPQRPASVSPLPLGPQYHGKEEEGGERWMGDMTSRSRSFGEVISIGGPSLENTPMKRTFTEGHRGKETEEVDKDHTKGKKIRERGAEGDDGVGVVDQHVPPLCLSPSSVTERQKRLEHSGITTPSSLSTTHASSHRPSSLLFSSLFKGSSSTSHSPQPLRLSPSSAKKVHRSPPLSASHTPTSSSIEYDDNGHAIHTTTTAKQLKAEGSTSAGSTSEKRERERLIQASSTSTLGRPMVSSSSSMVFSMQRTSPSRGIMTPRITLSRSPASPARKIK